MSSSGTDWSNLSRLLDAALTLPPEQRASWIEHLDGDDALFKVSLREILLKEVTELPRIPSLADEETRPPMPADTAADFGEVRVGETLLGRFKLQRIIGRGGMSLVFAARDLQMQGEPPVAVKVLNEAMRANPIA